MGGKETESEMRKEQIKTA